MNIPWQIFSSSLIVAFQLLNNTVCLEQYFERKKVKLDQMAEETEHRVEVPAQPEDKIVSVSQVEENTVSNVVKVDSYKDEHHINLTWRSWMVVL
jgi:hypothetical protein